jgi:hypothetical protein
MKALAKLLDYSSGVPSALSVKNAGYAGAIRYLHKRNPSGVHVLGTTETKDYFANGRQLALVYEDTSPSRASQGTSAGNVDSQWAMDQAVAAGIQSPRGGYFAVDYDAVPDTIYPYFEGIANRIGVSHSWAYGSYRVIEGLFAEGLITKGWQARAWSHGLMSTKACLYQDIGTVYVGGVGCDVDYALMADWGQHPYAAAPPVTPTPPAPPITEQDEEMTWIAKPTTKGTYLLVMPFAVTVLADGTSISNLENDLGIKATTLSDGDFARLKALVK